MGEFIDYENLKEQIKKSGDLKSYLFSIPVEPISADTIESATVSISSSGLTASWDTLTPSTLKVNGKTIEELVDERVEQYKELMRLQALGCKNCGGSINKETLTCEYCGTAYFLGNKPKDTEQSRIIAQAMSF